MPKMKTHKGAAKRFWTTKNGKLLRRKKFSRVQLKALDTAMPILRGIDHLWPWGGLSLIGIGVKK